MRKNAGDALKRIDPRRINLALAAVAESRLAEGAASKPAAEPNVAAESKPTYRDPAALAAAVADLLRGEGGATNPSSKIENGKVRLLLKLAHPRFDETDAHRDAVWLSLKLLGELPELGSIDVSIVHNSGRVITTSTVTLERADLLRAPRGQLRAAPPAGLVGTAHGPLTGGGSRRRRPKVGKWIASDTTSFTSRSAAPAGNRASRRAAARAGSGPLRSGSRVQRPRQGIVGFRGGRAGREGRRFPSERNPQNADRLARLGERAVEAGSRGGVARWIATLGSPTPSEELDRAHEARSRLVERMTLLAFRAVQMVEEGSDPVDRKGRHDLERDRVAAGLGLAYRRRHAAEVEESRASKRRADRLEVAPRAALLARHAAQPRRRSGVVVQGG